MPILHLAKVEDVSALHAQSCVIWLQVMVPMEAHLTGFLNPVQTLDSVFHLGVADPSSGVKVPIAVSAYTVDSHTADTACICDSMYASAARSSRPVTDTAASSADFCMWGVKGQSGAIFGLTTKVVAPAGATATDQAAAVLTPRQDLYEVQEDCVTEPAQQPQHRLHHTSGTHSCADGKKMLVGIAGRGLLSTTAHSPAHAASSMLQLLQDCQLQTQAKTHTLTYATVSSICRGPTSAAGVMQGAVSGLLRTAATEMTTLQVSAHGTDRRTCAQSQPSPRVMSVAAAAVPGQPAGILEASAACAGVLSRPQLVRSSIQAAQHDLFQLRPQPRGSLANLIPVPCDINVMSQLQPGEVLVQVRAIGVNFRDVLNVLGMYPGDPGPPGADCAGVVIAVGPAMPTAASASTPVKFRAGDAVFGIAPGSLGSCVTTNASNLVPMPAHLGFHEAATVPTVMVTGQVALLQAAHVAAGQTVLVHAAAGGVGLAAIQLLHAMGATVVATAGSAQKRAVLHRLGVKHVVSSRHTQFVAEVCQLGGVDVVLNSLTSSGMVAASLAVLKPAGRFIEISKRGIWARQQVSQERTDCSFAYIAVDFLAPACLQSSLQWVSAALTKGTICPLPSICHPLSNAAAAFRQMMQASHVGKVVLTHPATGMGSQSSAMGPSLTITGGLGGLGLLMAKWAICQAALPICLTLLSRSGRSTGSADFASLVKSGARVTAQMLDTSSQSDAAHIGKSSQLGYAMSGARATHLNSPLTTLLHASGILQDSMLQGQNAAALRAAMAPKVAGLAAMGSAIGLLPMQHVALISSVASLLGTAGQGNYAAANAALDAWASAQQAAGCVAKAIQWGAWSSTGMSRVGWMLTHTVSYQLQHTCALAALLSLCHSLDG